MKSLHVKSLHVGVTTCTEGGCYAVLPPLLLDNLIRRSNSDSLVLPWLPDTLLRPLATADVFPSDADSCLLPPHPQGDGSRGTLRFVRLP